MAGGGNIAFTMPARLGEPPGPNNQVALREPTFAIVSRAGIYGEIRIPMTDSFGAYARASLHGEQYYAEAQVPGSTNGSVGFSDAFYAFRLTATFRYRHLAE